VAEIGDITRFGSARKLASWAGLTPTVRGSDLKVRYGHISKQGSAWLRWAMNQAAQTAKRSPEFAATYASIAKRRGKKIATIAIARKLLTRAWHLLNQMQPASPDASTPLRRLDLLAAYGTAFSIAAAAQATLACIVSFWLLGFDTAGSPIWVFVIAIANAVLGVGLGLLCSAFARTEFQAVQFMPLVIAPQLLLAGIIVPRAVMPEWLQWISNVMPASYALEALQQVGRYPDLTEIALRDIAVVIGCAIIALCLAAATLRRRTP